ncbi:DUF1289 domain-containing protein [Granulosicoccaceae sp. 1_MG-2023]|nr:DUF1289 domain-containing protein [Granulosicoccaceae sp. 1_MG-2023]
MPDSPVRSPCVGLCSLDNSSGICAGCFRHIDEIIDWSAYSDDEKRAALARCAERRAKHPSPPPEKDHDC